MNTLVNFEIAKLLKEKGFDLYCVWSYWNSELTSHTPGYALEDGTTSQENYWDFDRYYAPTIAEVVMWLYEKHDVWIMVTKNHYETLVRWDFYVNSNFNNDYLNSRQHNRDLFGYYSPTEAYQAAIEYTLNNLI